jgi:hypothetical protein
MTVITANWCPLCGKTRKPGDFIIPASDIATKNCRKCRSLKSKGRNEMHRISQGRVVHSLTRKGVIEEMAQERAERLVKLPEQIAAIIGKTYAERGDNYELSDDTAVGMVRDLLLELDETIIQRNKDKRLSRRKASI